MWISRPLPVFEMYQRHLQDCDLDTVSEIRCMVRVKYNAACPYNFTIMKHTGWIATERTVRAHETRPDKLALAEETGHQSSYRHGSHQSTTRGRLPPMHQTDSLFHKQTGSMAFTFGFAIDNHAVNTVPKETLIKIAKAEPGGMDGKGIWAPAATGYGPGNENEFEQLYLAGGSSGSRGADGEYMMSKYRSPFVRTLSLNLL